ncbi:transcriptional regulator with XRE-family HTH domain [Bradyrhizobium elkanii]
MPGESGKKLFVGPRFRRIRQQLGLSQTQIAEGLGISPSYINLIERNQRPVTAQILLRLAETYDLDLRDLATADEDRFFAELNEIFSDPLFRQIDLPKQELRDLAELCPGVTHALQRLYAAYTEARRGETLVAAQMADREGSQFDANPIERVRDLIEANRNYFPELETAAENLRDELNVPTEGLFTALTTRLRERHSILTRVMPVDVMRETLRRFDRHRRQLLISELVDSSGRSFQLALQIGFVECGAAIDAIVSRAGPLDDTARRLYRITLANYFAAAAMMPYQAFHSAAEALSYDVHVLAQRFNAGFEQVCHRLTTLQRPNARGGAVLPAPRRQCRQRVEAVFLRHLPVLQVRRHLPALERALDLRHAGSPAQPGDRIAGRHALFLDRADGAPAGGALPAAAAALCDRARLRDPSRGQAHLCHRHGSGKGRGHPDRRQLPALRARELQPARRAADHAHPDPGRDDAAGVLVRVLECAGVVSQGSIHRSIHRGKGLGTSRPC